MRLTLGCRHYLYTKKTFKPKVRNNQNNNNNLNKNLRNEDSMYSILVSPVARYDNTKLLKQDILKDNRGKPGIYRWTNKINGNTYVGSGLDLTKRLRSYFNVNELKRSPRPITDALIKYGHDNFALEILEYCSESELLAREQYYLDSLVPEYNILKHAYSLQGYKHTEENINKFKSKIISSDHKELLSSLHKGKEVSLETREKLAKATADYKKNNPLSSEALANIRAKTLEREGVSVSVLNTETNEIKEYTNQTEAGKSIGVTRQAVYNAIKRGSTINGKYLISKIDK